MDKNNRYGHPKGEILDTLKNSKIYRTDLDGSIEIKLNLIRRDVVQWALNAEKPRENGQNSH